MSETAVQITPRQGDEVFGSEGDKVGMIVAVSSSYVVVEKGFFFPTDYYIPVSAIAGRNEDGDKIYLTVSKEEALNLGWDTNPDLSDRASDSPAYDASGGAVYAAERNADSFMLGSAALGTTGYMGESPTSPGLAADLTNPARAKNGDSV